MVGLDLEGVVAIALTGLWGQPLGYEVTLCIYGLLSKPYGISLYAVLVGREGYLTVLAIRGLCIH